MKEEGESKEGEKMRKRTLENERVDSELDKERWELLKPANLFRKIK